MPRFAAARNLSSKIELPKYRERSTSMSRVNTKGAMVINLPATTAACVGPARAAVWGNQKIKTVSMAALALAMPAAVALAPFAAQAASPNAWTGGTSNAWETRTNWSSRRADHHFCRHHRQSRQQPGPAQQQRFLERHQRNRLGALTVGAAPPRAPPTSLNINSGVTLTMGARPVTLNGGSSPALAP